MGFRSLYWFVARMNQDAKKPITSTSGAKQWREEYRDDQAEDSGDHERLDDDAQVEQVAHERALVDRLVEAALHLVARRLLAQPADALAKSLAKASSGVPDLLARVLLRHAFLPLAPRTHCPRTGEGANESYAVPGAVSPASTPACMRVSSR